MSSFARFLVLGAYFGGIGYVIGKKDIDKRVARLVGHAYDEIVAHTKSVPPADYIKVAINGE
jgi:hypothetical protein